MTSLIYGKDSKFSINFVTEKGQYLGFPLHWLNYWILEKSTLRVFFHSHTVELEGVFLERVVSLLEEGAGFRIIQVDKRYVENASEEKVFVWNMSFLEKT